MSDLESLPAVQRRKVARKIAALAANPRPHRIKKLRGAEEMYRLRSGDYRVIYSMADKKLLALVQVLRMSLVVVRAVSLPQHGVNA